MGVMAFALGDKMLDSGIGYVSSNADKIYICSQQPTTYAEATSTYALGSANFGVGLVAGAPQAATGGRKVATNAVTAGTISAVGTPTYWAIVDSVNSLLLATGPMTGSVTTDISKAWSLEAIEIVQTGALAGRFYDAATTAWAAAVVTAGGTVSTTRKGLVDDLIAGLKVDGIWAKLDRLWLLAAENETSALLDLKALGQATKVNSPVFTANLGYDVFERGGYGITLGYNLSANAVNYSQNSAHAGIWVTNTLLGLQNDAGIIDDGTGAVLQLVPKATDNNFYGRMHEASSGGIAIGSYFGWLVGNRSGASVVRHYFNGTDFGGNTVASNTVPSLGTKLSYRSYAAASLGGSLTATEQTNFYSRLRTYMTSVGVP